MALAPVWACAALAIRSTLGHPVLYKQVRIGKDQVPFTLWKFRTMRPPNGAEVELLSDARRVSRLGAVLRHTSLDEVPSLVNVIRGEMSIVGPRPLLPAYLPLYSPRERLRHSVRPGVTGLAQVSGRQQLSFKERFELDVYYVEHQSLMLDLRILFRTIAAVTTSRGVETGQSFDDIDDFGAQNALTPPSNRDHG